ncbi:hypothetical protein V6K52_10120 [Knoellia sp. S7-12]
MTSDGVAVVVTASRLYFDFVRLEVRVPGNALAEDVIEVDGSRYDPHPR